MRRRRCLLLLALPVASAVAGCASRRPSSRFGRGAGAGDGGPLRSGGATIGHDFKAAPRGRIIPPAGLGVDLVDSRDMAEPSAVASRGRLDGAVETTGSIARPEPPSK